MPALASTLRRQTSRYVETSGQERRGKAPCTHRLVLSQQCKGKAPRLHQVVAAVQNPALSCMQDEPPVARSAALSAELGAPAAERTGSGSLHRITPIPTDDSGTLYRKGRRVDSGLLTLPEISREYSAETLEGAIEARSSGSGAAGAGAGSGAAAGLEPKQAPEEAKQAAEAGQGDSGYEASEESIGAPVEGTAVAGMAPGAPAAAAAGQFWLSAAAEEPEAGRAVASHRVELRGALWRLTLCTPSWTAETLLHPALEVIEETIVIRQPVTNAVLCVSMQAA